MIPLIGSIGWASGVIFCLNETADLDVAIASKNHNVYWTNSSKLPEKTLKDSSLNLSGSTQTRQISIDAQVNCCWQVQNHPTECV